VLDLPKNYCLNQPLILQTKVKFPEAKTNSRNIACGSSINFTAPNKTEVTISHLGYKLGITKKDVNSEKAR
jgi:hypothetical protein